MKKILIFLAVIGAVSCKDTLLENPCNCVPPEHISFEKVNVPSNEDLTDISFSNGEGVLTGTYGFVALTENGGQSWTTVQKPSNESLLSADHLGGGRFFTGRKNLFFSEDQGNSFQDYTGNISDDDAIKGIYFINPQSGHIIKGNSVYSTYNSGVTWNVHSFVPGYLKSFQFITDNVGWMYGGITFDDVSVGELYKTTDAGTTWQKIQHEFKEILAATFINDSAGYIAGSDHKIWFTKNSGLSWELVSDNFPYTITSMTFRGALLVATYEGKILQFNTDNNSWKEIYQTPGGSALVNMHKTSAGKIWVVGNNAVLLKSN